MPRPPENGPGAPARSGSPRRDPAVLIAIAAALLAARIVLGVVEARHPVALPAARPGAPARDRVRWRTFGDGVTEARATGRPLLYDFTAAWCPPCRAMEAELFSDSAAAAALERRFVPVRVLDRQREDGHNVAWVDSLQSRYQVTAFPTLVVTEPGGAGESRRTTGFMGRDPTLFAIGVEAAGGIRFRFGGGVPDSGR